NPSIPLFASETASTVSSRGEYFFPVADDKSQGRADFQVSSYDLYAPRWATPPDDEFKGQDSYPFTAGEFVWTGFDYLGERTPYEYRLRWDDVRYEPGELRVVAYKGGKRWAEDVVKTTGPATRLTLKTDRARIAGDGRDLSFVTVSVADKEGLTVPRSKNHIRFEVSGPGEIVAVDNGDATSHEPFQAAEHSAYNG